MSLDWVGGGAGKRPPKGRGFEGLRGHAGPVGEGEMAVGRGGPGGPRYLVHYQDFPAVHQDRAGNCTALSIF